MIKKKNVNLSLIGFCQIFVCSQVKTIVLHQERFDQIKDLKKDLLIIH